MLDLSTLTYRAARNLRVVPYNRIASILGDQLPAASDFSDSGYGYAVFLKENDSASSEHNIVELDQETALLLLSIREPGPLPDYLEPAGKTEDRSGLLNLIYQGLIEVKLGDEFVTREAAASKVSEITTAEKTLLLGNNSRPALAPNSSAVAALSIEALQNADRLELRTADQLFRYLYQYQAIPINSKRRQELADDYRFLNLGEIGNNWVYSDSMEGWHYFSQRLAKSGSYMGKLYISPMLTDLPKAVATTATVLAGFDGVSFKVGKGHSGLQRPDKIVAYFSSLDSLMKAAEALQSALQGTKAHGVPFTSSYSPDGLISWGIDPKQKHGERQSWRQWLIEKLVNSMLCPSNDKVAPGRWKLALAQLELDGINPNTFRPGGTWITEYS